MIFKENAKLYDLEIETRQGEDVMYVNYLPAPSVPSIADNPYDMARAVDALTENPNISRIVFVQQRNYNYPFEQVSLLTEIARIYNFLTKQESILSPEKLSLFGNAQGVHGDLTYLLSLLRQDPLACHFELRSRLNESKAQMEAGQYANKTALMNYIRLIEKVFGLVENSKLIKLSLLSVQGYSMGSREAYRNIFRPDILPNFSFTRLVAQIPKDAELVDQYEVKSENESVSVTILKSKNDTKYFYHIMPLEYSLSEEHHMLINLARNVLTEHRPKAEEFTDPERTRQVFFNVARDLLSELSESKGMSLTYRELTKLARILVRHTIGFGLIEVLLMDTKLQDIVLNAPIAQNPVFVRHEKYDECSTNIIPSYEDAESWAAKLRLKSGRPLDEANPVLDTDLTFGNTRARVAAIKEPLSPSGLAFAFRRHRDDPWTLPLFIHNKMINSFAAGLLSFFIDGSRTVLVAGTRSSGKTSLLGSLLLEIMQKFRVIVVEDSVTADAKIIVKENGKFKKTTIGELIDEKIKKFGYLDDDGREKESNKDNIEIFSINEEGKAVLAKPSRLIRHSVNKPIFEVVTSSGRKIKVTEDHSLFKLDEKDIMKPIAVRELKEGEFIAIPRRLRFNNEVEYINLLEDIDKLSKTEKKIFVLGDNVGNYIKENRKELFALAYSLGYSKSVIQNWSVKNILPLEVFDKLKDKIKDDNLFLKSYGDSGLMPSKIKLDEDFLSFCGLWLADGCYDQRSIIVSVEEEENKALVRRVAKLFNLKAKMHSDGFSHIINFALLRKVMEVILELKGNSYTKQIPSWMYNLSDKQIGWLLKGYFSGDGCVSDKEVMLSSASKELINDLASLLLRFDILLRISTKEKAKGTPYGKDNTISSRIGQTKMLSSFRENIGFIVKSKQDKLNKLCERISTHDTSDIIPLSLEVKEELSEILEKRFNRNDYLTRDNAIGREHLNNLLKEIPLGITNPVDPLRKVVNCDVFWDKVKSVKQVAYSGFVYDLAVPEYENFICENIIAHNTLELPVDALRKLGYDILRMKVRSALVSGSSEMEAAEGIRTSLRLGDSALIVGEVRSTEAKALYEAMRVGALANVVAGTIHGDSPYGVFDRVVNDLEVPATSFKATDLIVVANPVKTPDGLHSFRRVVRVTEVRKHWKEDPLMEAGFIDLLRYNVETDELEPTPELINGDSEIIKSIASSVKGWAGNWDAVYDNILLRGRIKQEIVAMAKKFNKPQLMESGFNSLSNSAFHNISEKVIAEHGLPLSEYVFPEWKKWAEKVQKEF